MTLSDIYDRLCGRHINGIYFKDGSYVRCPAPLLVDWADSETPAQAWIELCEDGLVLHFNANRMSPQGQSGMEAQEEPLGNIASIS
jgi:hypothetical protein